MSVTMKSPPSGISGPSAVSSTTVSEFASPLPESFSSMRTSAELSRPSTALSPSRSDVAISIGTGDAAEVLISLKRDEPQQMGSGSEASHPLATTLEASMTTPCSHNVSSGTSNLPSTTKMILSQVAGITDDPLAPGDSRLAPSTDQNKTQAETRKTIFPHTTQNTKYTTETYSRLSSRKVHIGMRLSLPRGNRPPVTSAPLSPTAASFALISLSLDSASSPNTISESDTIELTPKNSSIAPAGPATAVSDDDTLPDPENYRDSEWEGLDAEKMSALHERRKRTRSAIDDPLLLEPTKSRGSHSSDGREAASATGSDMAWRLGTPIIGQATYFIPALSKIRSARQIMELSESRRRRDERSVIADARREKEFDDMKRGLERFPNKRQRGWNGEHELKRQEMIAGIQAKETLFQTMAARQAAKEKAKRAAHEEHVVHSAYGKTRNVVKTVAQLEKAYAQYESYKQRSSIMLDQQLRNAERARDEELAKGVWDLDAMREAAIRDTMSKSKPKLNASLLGRSKGKGKQGHGRTVSGSSTGSGGSGKSTRATEEQRLLVNDLGRAFAPPVTMKRQRRNVKRFGSLA